MKNKKILLLIITLVISVSQIDAMQHVWQQVIGRNFGKILIRSLPKEIAKKAFSKTMTGLHWGISAVPMIDGGIILGMGNEMFGVKFPFITENVSKNVESFAQETLHDSKIKVVNFSENQPSLLQQIIVSTIPAKATNKQIILNPNLCLGLSNLDELIKNYNTLTKSDKQLSELEEQELKSVNQQLDEYKYVLSHEYNHQKAKDLHRFIAAACTIPFGTHCITRRIGRKVLPLAKSSSSFWWFFKELSKIPTGCAKLLTNVGLLTAYKKRREQKADDNTPNDKAILQGGIRFFKRVQKLSEENLQKIKNSLSPGKRKALALIKRLLLDSHPPIENRIKKLEERIKKLDS